MQSYNNSNLNFLTKLIQNNLDIIAKLSSSPSSVQLELRLALILVITPHPHPPTHPHPPGKVEMQLESHHIWSVGSWWIVCLCLVIFGGRG